MSGEQSIDVNDFNMPDIYWKGCPNYLQIMETGLLMITDEELRQ